MPTMPSDRISDAQEKILLNLWKLRGVGSNRVNEEALRAAISSTAPETWVSQTDQLRQQGFVESATENGRTFFSLTPLGLSILRQLQEDKLQELK